MPLPRFQPLPVTRRSLPFDHPDWVFELKQDGFRTLAYIDGGRCRLISRNDNQFHSFQALNDSISKALKGHSLILDGEIVSLDGCFSCMAAP